MQTPGTIVTSERPWLTFPNTVTPEEVIAAVSSHAMLRVWVDDDLEDRTPGLGWMRFTASPDAIVVHVTTAHQAIALVDTGRVVDLSLDNDLMDDQLYGQGKHVIDFIVMEQGAEGRDLWPRDGVTLHTANAAARAQMGRAIDRWAGMIYEVRHTMTSGGKRRFTFGPLAPGNLG